MQVFPQAAELVLMPVQCADELWPESPRILWPLLTVVRSAAYVLTSIVRTLSLSHLDVFGVGVDLLLTR